MPEATEKIAGLWFAKGDYCPGWHYEVISPHKQVDDKSHTYRSLGW